MSVFNLIKARVSIFDVINEYTTLKKAGAYWKSRCPFHHEKTGSFTVSPHKEIFYCFGCHAGGDVISFIAKIENCSQHEAVQFLADRYNIELPKDIEYNTHSTQEKKHYFDICKMVAQWCHLQLQKNSTILSYLKTRSISPEMIKLFEVGYFPGGSKALNSLIAAASEQHILIDDLLQAHIVGQSKATHYSPFEDRIIFPIKDHLGRFCGFGGRIYKPEDTRPKYYNSRENDYFQKGHTLWGLDSAKKTIQDEKRAFLVEGYIDCIAMVQAGFHNTVATLGTACTLAHLKLLARYTPHLYVMFDSDTAGEKAILRLTELCWQSNMELKVVTLPQGHDPASCLAAQYDLTPYIAGAKDIFAYFIELLGSQFHILPLHERIKKIKQLIEVIAVIDEPLKQDILIQTASQALGMPFESIKSELIRQKKTLYQETPPPQEPSPLKQATHGTISLEKQIFCAILNNPELYNAQNDYYVIEQLEPQLKIIITKLAKEKETKGSLEFASFFDTLDESQKKIVSESVVIHSEPVDMAAYKELLNQLQKKRWKLIIQSITAQLERAHTEGDQQTVDRLLHDYRKIKEKMTPFFSGHSSKEGAS